MGHQSSPANAHWNHGAHTSIAAGSERSKPELSEGSSRRPDATDDDDNDRQRVSQASDAFSQHQSHTSTNSQQRPGRRFLPQPVETSSRSSKTRQATLTEDHDKESDPVCTGATQSRDTGGLRPPRKFLPELIETSQASNRNEAGSATQRAEDKGPASRPPGHPRRFKPDLIETDTRSVRRSQSHQPHQNRAYNTSPSQGTDSDSDAISNATSYSLPESKCSYASLLRRQGIRRQSFRVPDLPSIPSNSSAESEESKSPSLSTSPPRMFSSKRQDEKSPCESCDGKFSEYLLSLAACSAQMQLEEQALAAFPNEQVYQPVDHFAAEEEDRDPEEENRVDIREPMVKSRRQSSADLSWELEYMRQHKEEAEMRLRTMVASKNANLSSMATFTHPATHPVPESEKKPGASPPMLGGDLVMPQSLSPDGTICETGDVDHDSRKAQDPCSRCGGLWCASPVGNPGHHAGLWMGTCHKPVDRTGEVRSGSDWKGSRYASMDQLATSPEFSDRLNVVSSSLRKLLDDEFNDEFVTQIYNYLSLGYPCLARYFDHELSQISGISVEDLRRDDLQTDAKGYVVAPVAEDKTPCMRWKALRLYIHDWVRQQPNMEDEEMNVEAWGMPERRGSWAL